MITNFSAHMMHRAVPRPVSNPSSRVTSKVPTISEPAAPPPASTSTSTSSSSSQLSDFQKLFLYGSAGTPAAPSSNNTTPIPITPFAATYETNATVSGPGGSQSLNPIEYATADTAQRLATMLGGTVVEDQLSGAWTNSVPMREIAIPGTSAKLNAGLTAQLFAQYGTQTGGYAWQRINLELGLPPNHQWPGSQGGSAA